jgi:hypothetical protein
MERFTCAYCDKYFMFKLIYEQHQPACEYFHQNRYQRQRNIESIEKLPSPQELFHLVQTLTLQNKIFAEKISRLEANSAHRIKRNAIGFLQKAPIPKEMFNSWIKIFEIKQNYLDEIFENNLTSGMKKCLSDRICNEGLTNIPLRAFKEKPGILYIYTDQNEEKITDPNKMNEKSWKVCSKETFAKLIDEMNNKITIFYVQWENEQENERIDLFSDKHLLCGLKVLGSKINKERQKVDIKSYILSIIQMSLV